MGQAGQVGQLRAVTQTKPLRSGKASKPVKGAKPVKPVKRRGRFEPEDPGAEKLLLTIAEAGARLGMSRSTVYGLVVEGRLQSIKISRYRRVPVVALTRFIEEELAAQA